MTGSFDCWSRSSNLPSVCILHCASPPVTVQLHNSHLLLAFVLLWALFRARWVVGLSMPGLLLLTAAREQLLLKTHKCTDILG